MKEEVTGCIGAFAAILAFVELFIGEVEPRFLLVTGALLLTVAIVVKHET